MNWKPLIALLVFSVAGCSSQAKVAQLSGKLTFKGQPVPAGYISFTPDVAAGNLGQIKVLQVKDGVFDSAKEPEPGLKPGKYQLRIAGFDGVRIPLFGQGKQIFNAFTEDFEVPEGTTTKEFIVPPSAGENVKIEKTADT
jgi:hypothetical protein